MAWKRRQGQQGLIFQNILQSGRGIGQYQDFRIGLFRQGICLCLGCHQQQGKICIQIMRKMPLTTPTFKPYSTAKRAQNYRPALYIASKTKPILNITKHPKGCCIQTGKGFGIKLA